MKLWHWMALAVVSFASLVAEFTMEHHSDEWWSSIPAFYILFGFVGCGVIIFFSKVLGKFFLQKREDYYDVR
ncbi:MAG: hypothetical protein HY708_08140 [Ignavibacteriae bacterium]|nr:hypothetical protein [Ignavibacteriota bacterium]